MHAHLALLAIALAGASVAGVPVRPAAAQQDRPSSAQRHPLRLPVVVLPVFSSAPEKGLVPAPDLDGYLDVVPPPAAPGPAALIRRWLGEGDELAPVLAERSPREQAPFQVQFVLLAFDHRPSAAAPNGWEAYVELAVRVSNTGRDAELCSGFYSAASPARGALTVEARRRLLARGLSAYLETPLGRAFELAARQAIAGPGTNPRPAGATPGEQPGTKGIRMQLAGVLWETTVKRLSEGGYGLGASKESGLQVGDELTPYVELDSPPGSALRRKRVAGLLRVTKVEGNQVLAEDVPGKGIPAGLEVTGAYFGSGNRSGFTEALVAGTGVPPEFMEALTYKLNYLELSSNGAWPKDTLFAQANGRPANDRVSVEVKIEDSRNKVELASWVGIVRAEDAKANAEECIRAMWPKIMAKANIGAPFPITATGCPEPFKRTLETLLGSYVALSRQTWSPETLGITATGSPAGTATNLNVRLEDLRANPPKLLGQWTEKVAEAEAEIQALECYHRLKSSLQEAAYGGGAGPKGGGTVATPVALNGQAGAMERLLQNRKQDLRIWLRFAPNLQLPEATYFKPGQTIKFLIRASADCWILGFNYDSARNVNRLWEDFRPLRLRKGEAKTIEAPVFGTLGQEYLVVLAWQEEEPALQMAANFPNTLDQLSGSIRKGGYKLSVLPDPDEPLAEPSAPAVALPSLKEIRLAAAQFAKSENGQYAVAWLQFHTGK